MIFLRGFWIGLSWKPGLFGSSRRIFLLLGGRQATKAFMFKVCFLGLNERSLVVTIGNGNFLAIKGRVGRPGLRAAEKLIFLTFCSKQPS